MAALLALASAATWSVGDFLGGLASTRAHSVMVTAISQIAGLLALALLIPLTGVSPQREALMWGLVAGIGGSGGLLFYFRALAIGPMGVTAPLAAVVGAAVPIVVGLSLGERPSALAFVGIALAIVATVLVSRTPANIDHAPHEAAAARDRVRRGALAAAMAGLLFGLFFVAIDQAPDDGGLWPLVTARMSGLTMLSIVLLVLRPPRAAAPEVRLSLLAGLLDMAANALFLLASQQGLLTLTSVLASLYPVGVVLLARVVLKEQLLRTQWTGVVLALGASVLIAL